MTTKVKKRGVSSLPFSVAPIEEYRRPEEVERDIDNLKNHIQSLKIRRAGSKGDKVYRLSADGAGKDLETAKGRLNALTQELETSLAQAELMEKDRTNTGTTFK
jgi:hypothetical protein